MSLEGTLETVALPDVLALLSVTSKTGQLYVESTSLNGSLWIDAGRIAGFEVGASRTLADALFTLLRLDHGSFAFRAEVSQPAKTVPPAEVTPLLEEAEARLEKWPSIVAVVPSLASRLALSQSVGETVTLLPEQWQLVAAIGGGKEAGAVLADLDLGEFDGCSAVKDLAELGLVHVTEAISPEGSETSLVDSPFASSGAYSTPEADPEAAGEAAAQFDPQFEAAAEPGADPEAAGEAAAQFDPQFDAQFEAAADPGAQLAAAGDSGAHGAGDWTSELSWSYAPGPDEFTASEQSSEVWSEPQASDAEGEEQVTENEAVEAEQDPVNRGLLLKFLGSTRN